MSLGAGSLRSQSQGRDLGSLNQADGPKGHFTSHLHAPNARLIEICHSGDEHPFKPKRKIMLGDHLGTIQGPTSMKAMPAIGGMPTLETTASGLTGMLAGSEVTSFATYSATMRADGSFYGECPNAGVVMTADGVATFRATGAGNPTADGGFVFKGVVYFEAQAPSLGSLNGKAVVYDWIVDPEGNATWDLWEWA